MSDDNKTKTDKWVVTATHFFWFAIVVVVFLYYRSENRAALKQANEVRMWAKIVQTNAEELRSATRRLGGENWGLAVPKVRRAADDLYGSVEQLCTEVSQLEDELTPDPVVDPAGRNPW